MITRGLGNRQRLVTRGFGGAAPVIDGIKKHIIAFLFVITSVCVRVKT